MDASIPEIRRLQRACLEDCLRTQAIVLDHLRQSARMQIAAAGFQSPTSSSWRDVALGATLLAMGMVIGLGFVAAGVRLVGAVTA